MDKFICIWFPSDTSDGMFEDIGDGWIRTGSAYRATPPKSYEEALAIYEQFKDATVEQPQTLFFKIAELIEAKQENDDNTPKFKIFYKDINKIVDEQKFNVILKLPVIDEIYGEILKPLNFLCKAMKIVVFDPFEAYVMTHEPPQNHIYPTEKLDYLQNKINEYSQWAKTINVAKYGFNIRERTGSGKPRLSKILKPVMDNYLAKHDFVFNDDLRKLVLKDIRLYPSTSPLIRSKPTKQESWYYEKSVEFGNLMILIYLSADKWGEVTVYCTLFAKIDRWHSMTDQLKAYVIHHEQVGLNQDVSNKVELFSPSTDGFKVSQNFTLKYDKNLYQVLNMFEKFDEHILKLADSVISLQDWHQITLQKDTEFLKFRQGCNLNQLILDVIINPKTFETHFSNNKLQLSKAEIDKLKQDFEQVLINT